MHLKCLAIAVVLSTLAACDRAADKPSAPATPTSPAASDRGEPDDTYTVRGEVVSVPSPDKPTAEFFVKHEAIDEFKNPGGTRGMNSMTMPFPLGKGVSLQGLAPGDKIEFVMAVWTTPGKRGYEIRKITRLPAETELHFGKANPKP